MGGIIVLLLFYAITLWASLMLAECQETDGVKHPTYRAAVKHILGEQLQCARARVLASCARSLTASSRMPCAATHVHACVRFAPRAGPGDAVVITIFQNLNLILSSIGYTVAAGQSLR